MIKIVPSGDYVQLKYVDTLGEYVQEELKSDADAIEYSSDSGGKIYLKFGRMTFDYFDSTEFEINGSAVTDAADFITKLTALFSGSGGGSSFLPTSGTGTATGDIIGGLNGHELIFQDIFGQNLGYWDSENSYINAINTHDGNTGQSGFSARAYEGDDLNNKAEMLSGDGSGHSGSISINGSLSSIIYTADTHTFNGVVNLPTQAAPASPNDGDIWREDNTDTGLKIRINGVTRTIIVS